MVGPSVGTWNCIWSWSGGSLWGSVAKGCGNKHPRTYINLLAGRPSIGLKVLYVVVVVRILLEIDLKSLTDIQDDQSVVLSWI